MGIAVILIRIGEPTCPVIPEDPRSMLGLHLHFGEGAYFPVPQSASGNVWGRLWVQGCVFLRFRV